MIRFVQVCADNNFIILLQPATLAIRPSHYHKLYIKISDPAKLSVANGPEYPLSEARLCIPTGSPLLSGNLCGLL